MDMVKISPDGRVQSMVLKPPTSELRRGWVCAVWSPVFHEFMHTFVQRARGRGDAEPDARPGRSTHKANLPFGAVMKSAFEAGLHMWGLHLPDDSYSDIGVPDRLVEAIRLSSSAIWQDAVVQVARGTETGGGARWQGATTENTERI